MIEESRIENKNREILMPSSSDSDDEWVDEEIKVQEEEKEEHEQEKDDEKKIEADTENPQTQE